MDSVFPMKSTRYVYSLTMVILTFHDMLSDDINMVVPIRSGVFMPKSNNMPKFMDDNSKLFTVFSY